MVTPKEPSFVGRVSSATQTLDVLRWLDDLPRGYVLRITEGETSAEFVVDDMEIEMLERVLRQAREKPKKPVAVKPKPVYDFLADAEDDNPFA
jgi:hypothetical protein